MSWCFGYNGMCTQKITNQRIKQANLLPVSLLIHDLRFCSWSTHFKFLPVNASFTKLQFFWCAQCKLGKISWPLCQACKHDPRRVRPSIHGPFPHAEWQLVLDVRVHKAKKKIQPKKKSQNLRPCCTMLNSQSLCQECKHVLEVLYSGRTEKT